MALRHPGHLDTILSFATVRPVVFVESGTFHGKTTRWARERFPRVHTIELNYDWYIENFQALTPLGVSCYHGNSAVIIPQLAAKIQEPVCWFLDAHFFKLVPEVAGEKEGLPLWDELRAIAARPFPDIVIVDDVAMFGTSHVSEDWREVSLDRIAEYFPGAQHRILFDQAVVYR